MSQFLYNNILNAIKLFSPVVTYTSSPHRESINIDYGDFKYTEGNDDFFISEYVLP